MKTSKVAVEGYATWTGTVMGEPLDGLGKGIVITGSDEIVGVLVAVMVDVLVQVAVGGFVEVFVEVNVRV